MYSKISIIIPCYNCSSTIQRCLESILLQEKFDGEIICIDDASSDDTVYKIKQFETVKLFINPENKGPAYSRNKGVQYAQYQKLLFKEFVIIRKRNLVN